MERLRIFTNNPAVQDAYPHLARYMEGGVPAVFTALRDAVHKGARFVTYPLSGSVKPWESPYKSVAVWVKGDLHENRVPDFTSLQLIEDAMRYVSTSAQFVPKWIRNADESLWEDYRIIDLDLIKNALEANSWYTTSLS
jgi:hypothetical protein